MRDEFQLNVYEPIGADFLGTGFTAKKARNLIEAAGDVRRIIVRLNSPGGNVFDATAIFNLLKQHKAPVTVYVDGIAASAASVIAMAGDKIIMGEGTFLMIHQASGLALGTADDMEQMAGALRKVDGELGGIYARRSGQKPKAVAEMMAGETWMTAAEAVDKGFADEALAEPAPTSARARGSAEIVALTERIMGSYKAMPEEAKHFFNFAGAANPPAPEIIESEGIKMPEKEPAAGDSKAAKVETTPAPQAEAKVDPALIEKIASEATAKAKAEAKADTEAQIKAERERSSQIRAKAREFGFAELGDKLVDEGADVNAALHALKDAKLEQYRKGGAPAVGPDPATEQASGGKTHLEKAHAYKAQHNCTIAEALLKTAPPRA